MHDRFDVSFDYDCMHTIYGKMSAGEIFAVFHSTVDNSVNSVKYGLVDQQYKSTELLQQKVYRE